MREISKFVMASGRWGVASEIAAFIVFLIGIWEHFRDKSLTAFVFISISIPLFWIGAYLAWSKERYKLDELQRYKELPKLYLGHLGEKKSATFEIFVQVEGSKKAFEVRITSPPAAGVDHMQLEMQWGEVSQAVGNEPVPVSGLCSLTKGTMGRSFGGSQIENYLQSKAVQPQDLIAVVNFKDVDGNACPERRFRIHRERNLTGNFAIFCDLIGA
jgi:hypothetical protein